MTLCLRLHACRGFEGTFDALNSNTGSTTLDLRFLAGVLIHSTPTTYQGAGDDSSRRTMTVVASAVLPGSATEPGLTAIPADWCVLEVLKSCPNKKDGSKSLLLLTPWVVPFIYQF